MLPLLLLLSPAWAHRPGISFLELEPDHIALTFARPELARLGPVDDLDAASLLLSEATLDKVELRVGDLPCQLGPARVEAVEGDGVQISAALDCPVGQERALRATYLADFPPGHRSFLQADGEAVAVLDAAHDSATLGPIPSGWAVARRFLGLGVEHIWTGYDHLAFLLGLLLVATRLRQMLLIVTGFTLAHSLTLSLAATGVFTLPPAFVEPAIAASIAFVGLENLWGPTDRRRLFTTFSLGLIHGFGFAGLLAELGLPRHALALALVSFNGGVELGQAAVVGLTLPVLLWLRRSEAWRRRAVPLASLAVAAAGLYWLVERLAGLA